MHLPIDEALVLPLLVVFFAVQQRQRPESYFRFWLTGWVLVLVSVVARMVMHVGGGQVVLESLCEDALLCGGIAFQFSSIVSEHRRRSAVVAAWAIAVPVCFDLDLIVAGYNSAPMLILVIAVCEGLALYYAYRFLHARDAWIFTSVASLCAIHAALMIDLVLRGHAAGVNNLALAQTFVTAGVLLLGEKKARQGRWVGSLGFFAWGLSHLMIGDLGPHNVWVTPLHDLRMLPKYLVVFGMILRLFDEKNTEIAGLGSRYRNLYEDFRVLYQGNPHPMWVYDGASLKFLSVNTAAVRAYGFSEEEFRKRTINDLIVPTEGERGGQPDGESVCRSGPVRHRRANGAVFDAELTEHAINFQGIDACFVLAVDITQREDLNRDLVYRAQHDVLTGLPNRMVLEDRLMHWVTRCGHEGSMGALLTVDIDHFKHVNDTYGHLIGDECLKITAERLRSRIRQVDTIARTGGEEFTIVIGNLRNREGAEKVCSVLLQIFEAPIVLKDGLELKVTVSIGAAMYPEDGMDLDGLRRRSDEALYEAKRTGRSRVVFARRVEEQVDREGPMARTILELESGTQEFATATLSGD